jgi:ribosome maturation factor RimP
MARLERLAASEGLELLAAETSGPARRPLLRLVIDRAGSGVTVDDCEVVSRQASLLLDEADPFPGPYTLEVSSPGLDRKFYKGDDFERFSGRAVKVRMRPTWRGSKVVEGYLQGRGDGSITVREPAGDLIALPEEEVFETRLAPFLEERLVARGAGRHGTSGDQSDGARKGAKRTRR